MIGFDAFDCECSFMRMCTVILGHMKNIGYRHSLLTVSLFSQDMKVFISEEEFFSDFTNPDKLFWEYDNLEYGDWTSGPNGDGSVTYTDIIPATEVCVTTYKVCVTTNKVCVTTIE